MFAHVFPEPRLRAPLYYRGANDTQTVGATPDHSISVQVFPEPVLRSPFYYRTGFVPTNDQAPGPPDFVFPWRAQFIAVAKPPIDVGRFFQRNTEHDTSVPPPTEFGTETTWRPPIVYRQPSLAAFFQTFLQTSDTSGVSVTAQPDQPPSWTPRAFPPIKPSTAYLFASGDTSTPQPAQDPSAPTWRPPITYQPQDTIVMFPGILGADVPAPPTPEASTNATWAPRPLSIPKVPPSWRYIWNQPTDNVDESGSQFQVLWNYQTNYEKTARLFFQRCLSNPSRGDIQIPEQSTFPGYTPRPLRIEQLPKIARELYQWNQAKDQNAASTPEAEAFPGFTGRALWPFMAPKGAYAYYFSGLGKDVPPPLPTPTFHQPPTMAYMRRLELLGVRLGMTAAGWPQ